MIDFFPISVDPICQVTYSKVSKWTSLGISGPEVIKIFMLNSAELDIFSAHKC